MKLIRVLIIFLSVLFVVIISLAGVLWVTFLGPSEAARDKLTLSLIETSAAKFVPRLFMPTLLVEDIIIRNAIIESSEITDTSLISLAKPPSANNYTDSFNTEDEALTDEWDGYEDGLRLENIKGSTYRGYVLLIADPATVYVATSSDFKSGKPGLRITEAVEKEGARAAINGGGFPDVNGVGLGNLPIGLVFSKGEKLWGDENTVYSSVLGFDENNVFIVGNMSPKQAKELKIRDALCFGPTLVVNGEAAQMTGLGGGVNPRSAIGQRADGVVIFLCIDGRMPSSLGASYSDLAEIMLEYGAINAANLDGGMSSHLIYNGEIINIGSSLYAPRRIPTFFMVSGE